MPMRGFLRGGERERCTFRLDPYGYSGGQTHVDEDNEVWGTPVNKYCVHRCGWTHSE